MFIPLVSYPSMLYARYMLWRCIYTVKGIYIYEAAYSHCSVHGDIMINPMHTAIHSLGCAHHSFIFPASIRSRMLSPHRMSATPHSNLQRAFFRPFNVHFLPRLTTADITTRLVHHDWNVDAENVKAKTMDGTELENDRNPYIRAFSVSFYNANRVIEDTYAVDVKSSLFAVFDGINILLQIHSFTFFMRNTPRNTLSFCRACSLIRFCVRRTCRQGCFSFLSRKYAKSDKTITADKS